MDQTENRLFPWNAINDYMLPEFRAKVIGTVLRGINELAPEKRTAINALLRRLLNVPGFRNPAGAPLGVRVRGAVSPFERYSDFCALILQSWCDLNPVLRDEVYKALEGRSFENLLPPTEDRSLLGGFQTTWPKAETYEALDEAYFSAFPDKKDTSTDDIRLMAVWLVNRLPYDLFGEDEPEAD